MRTDDATYAQRLRTLQFAKWKQVLHVQAPYQANLRRQHLGRTLDVGCGIGRNLGVLEAGSVGVDHNETSIKIAREAGFTAYTLDEFAEAQLPHESFDGLLFAHILEHMDAATGVELVEGYLPYLRHGGTVFIICPQERGFATDETHVEFMDGPKLRALCEQVGLTPGRVRSFPFPRAIGKAFAYNEFCLRATKQ
ncbi:class I SAM-dependent methyltransferase [Flexivirga caeni]|uniref:Methyltransferase domain-containing protein n=1 Tax=Flexivirga caeni TaxID=2294115 RepID=A0A3M9MIN1_9MICO|nr:class I SAM-dependent methyltransferase [Flexivirga caeni]RNI25391.1 methyltransferase domain-containing protein [Flexivirga caeni]